MKSTIGLYFLAIMLVLGCSQSHPYAIINVSESQGLHRELEYVTAEIPMTDFSESRRMIATDTELDKAVPVQIADTLNDGGTRTLQVVFPVTIDANASKVFRIDIEKKETSDTYGNGGLSAETFHVENETYKVLFSDADPKGGGQINGIILSNFQDQLLKRGHISMHWAPNFSKTDSDKYFNFENLNSSSRNESSAGRYQVVKERSGVTDSVPEIDIAGRYTFYDALPYFRFESSMIMNADVKLDLLRNDEMTMDSLFTHVVYQEEGKKPIHHELYGEAKSIFEGRNITDWANFVAFYHKEKGYGLAAIRLLYDNTNLDGNRSPTSEPYTKITRSSGNGRYWSRVLSDKIQNFPKGSRYQEENAYLIFEVDETSPEKEILYYWNRLQNPLKVSVGVMEE